MLLSIGGRKGEVGIEFVLLCESFYWGMGCERVQLCVKQLQWMEKPYFSHFIRACCDRNSPSRDNYINVKFWKCEIKKWIINFIKFSIDLMYVEMCAIWVLNWYCDFGWVIDIFVILDILVVVECLELRRVSMRSSFHRLINNDKTTTFFPSLSIMIRPPCHFPSPAYQRW